MSNQESQGRLCIGNRDTHCCSAVLLPQNPSCLSSIPWLVMVKEHPAKNCHSFAMLGTERSFGEKRGWKRREGSRARRKEGARKKVCEHLTFPFLLWGLVLVKRFPDILADTSVRPRSSRLIRVRVDLSEGCARHVEARRDISFRLTLNEFAWLPNGS